MPCLKHFTQRRKGAKIAKIFCIQKNHHLRSLRYLAPLREQKSRLDRLGIMILNLVNLRLKQYFKTKIIRQSQIHEFNRLKLSKYPYKKKSAQFGRPSFLYVYGLIIGESELKGSGINTNGVILDISHYQCGSDADLL